MENIAPIIDVDPYADDFLAQCYEDYEAIRDTGPVIRFSTYNAYAIARQEDVQTMSASRRQYNAHGPGGRRPGNLREIRESSDVRHRPSLCGGPLAALFPRIGELKGKMLDSAAESRASTSHLSCQLTMPVGDNMVKIPENQI